jgi:hypothetical protein
VRVSSSPADDLSPAWSPDGRWIAFLRCYPEGQTEVVVIPALGGPERELGELVKSVRFQACSGLSLLSLESRERRKLTSPSPQWVGGRQSGIFSGWA